MTKNSSPYNGALTREQFLFYEMRTTAKLIIEGLAGEEVISRIVSDNLFQFPTERMIKRMSKVCIRRLNNLDDDLIESVAVDSIDTAKQICLYAMMLDNRLVWEFMVTVIGEKYRTQDMHFNQMDLNSFFMRLQEQDDKVASWSEQTIKKIKSVLKRLLIDNEYIADSRSDVLLPVMIGRKLENSIKESGCVEALPAFNCFK